MKYISPNPLVLSFLVLVLVSLACSFGRSASPAETQPAKPEPVRPVPTATRPAATRIPELPAGTLTRTTGPNSGCKEASQQPNKNYISDSDSRGGSDAVTFFADDTSMITMQVPGHWECDGSQWKGTITLDGKDTPFNAASLIVSLTLEEFNAFGNGVAVSVSSDWIAAEDRFASLLRGASDLYKICTAAGTADYSTSLFEGRRADYENCGSEEKMAIVYALAPKADPTAYLVLVELRYTSKDDLFSLRDMMKNTTINR